MRNATHKALHFFLEFLNEFFPEPTDMNDVPKPEAK